MIRLQIVCDRIKVDRKKERKKERKMDRNEEKRKKRKREKRKSFSLSIPTLKSRLSKLKHANDLKER